MNTTRYLNVDCILRSEQNLSEVLSSLKDNFFLLWDEPYNNGSFIGFETNLVNTEGPQEDIVEFLRLFESQSVQKGLAVCQEKIFDIGFESGDSGDLVDVVLESETISRIAELGFTIKIRIYPVPPTNVVKEKEKR